jgi:ABC-type transporter Mla MlaB component
MNSGTLRRLLSKMDTLRCDVRALPADAAAIDGLARLQLAARRAGIELRLCHASPELCALLELIGLDSVLCVEPERQPEEREQRLGVEEEGELADPPA